MSGKGCISSRPGSYGVPERTWTNGPGFSLCAVSLELSGPGFQSVWQRSDEPVEVQSILDWRMAEETWRVRGGIKIVNLVGDGVANLVENLGGLT